jgi:hypothetical protein
VATTLSAAIQAAYLAWRKNPDNAAAVPMSGLVSELQPGDYLRGPRAVVTVFGTLSGSNRTLTVTRLGKTFTLVYPNGDTVHFDR